MQATAAFMYEVCTKWLAGFAVLLLYVCQAWLRRGVTGAVLKALHDLQQPSNCNAVKKLYCDLGKSCGFGCQLHHVVHCFTIAVALKRTMVVKVSWRRFVARPATAKAAASPANSSHLCTEGS